jgi:hypothetical protein
VQFAIGCILLAFAGVFWVAQLLLIGEMRRSAGTGRSVSGVLLVGGACAAIGLVALRDSFPFAIRLLPYIVLIDPLLLGLITWLCARKR